MSLPPVTTAQQPNALITTTAVNLTNSNQTSPPALRTRPTGWHAKSFGFDWNKRSDHHKYLVKSGLPEVHAAIVNDDWDLALELIGPDDFGLVWLPPASQRQPQNGGTDLDASTWTVDLLNKNENIRDDAILRMALHINHVTSQDNSIFYGANFLTLCLLKPARPDVLQQIITLAATVAPKYLNLADAVGRTPLWVAIENHDQASMHLLLKAGADPLQACKFSAESEPKSPLSFVARSSDKEIFRDLLRATFDQGKKFTPYDYSKDPLCLKLWASGQSSDDVLRLADQVQALKGPLLCCKDKTGSSFFYRSVIDGSLDKKLASGNEDLIDWIRNLDTSPAISDDIESSPMYAAAWQASIYNYEKLYEFFIARSKEISNTQKLYQSVDKFLLSKTAKDYDLYLDGIPENLRANKLDLKKKFIQSQLKAISLNASKIIWDDYARTVKSVWPFISDDEKNVLIKEAVFISNDHKEFVLSLLDCELKESTLDEILKSSGRKRNKMAFEFAAERSIWSPMLLEGLRQGKDVGHEMFLWAVDAGSLTWIEKLIAAGFDLQVIADRPGLIAQLADIDPQGLAKKLKGLDYKITSHMLEQTKTEAGQQALTALMTKANNHG
jgi:hypothetical protein